MKSHSLIATSALALVTAAPLAFGQTTSGPSRSATQPPAATGTTNSTSMRTSGRIDAKPVQDLEAAAQRLREAVHALAQTPAGPQRNEAIRQANRTLLEVQNAMAALPPEVLLGAGNEGNYKKAMDRLEAAAQRLRDASHALAREPVGAERAAAIRAINKALIDTQQVMLDVPITQTSAAAK